jgi:alpha-N-acetylglucosaminidase
MNYPYLAGLVGAFIQLIHCQSVQGIYDLIARRIPQHKDSFKFTLTNSGTVNNFTHSRLDEYVVTTANDGTINVEGNTLSAINYG